jgi:tetratricopeptide (TPR) repeat protein
MSKIISVFFLISLFLFSCNGQEQNKKKDIQQQENSLEVLTQKIEQSPNDASLLIQRADFYQKNMQTNNAIADMQAALNIEPQNTDYYLILVDYFMQAGQLKNTIGVLKKILSIDSKNSAALLKMAEINLILKKYPDVFVYTNSVLENDPYNAKAFFIRGYSYKEMGDTNKAIENFRETVKYDPKNYNAFNELGLIFTARRDIIALDYFKNAIAVDSVKEDAYYYIGMYYQNNDYLNEALDIYRELIKRSPNFPYSYYNTGFIYLELLKVPDEAIPYFTQAIQVNPNYFEAYFNRGLCFEILGDVYKAQDDYQMALKIHPEYQKAIDGLNRIHEIMNR